MKLLLPALPGTVNDPVTFFHKVHFGFLRFLRVRVLHLRETRRPLVLRWTVNLTALGSDRLNETLVPVGRCFWALYAGPELAALKTVDEKLRPPSVGLVESVPPGGAITGFAGLPGPWLGHAP